MSAMKSLLTQLIAIGPLGVLVGGGKITSSLDIHQGEVYTFITREQQRKTEYEVCRTQFQLRLSKVEYLTIPVLPGLTYKLI